MSLFSLKIQQLQLRDLPNLLAGLALLINFLNPSTAFAETPRNLLTLETFLTSAPGARLVHEASQPRVIVGTLTAYTSTADQTDGNPFVTASGKKVDEFTIAANGLPFGTVIKIPSLFGNKRFLVNDRMNPRYHFGHFDVWLNTSRREALRFGVKHVPIEIYLPEQQLAAK